MTTTLTDSELLQIVANLIADNQPPGEKLQTMAALLSEAGYRPVNLDNNSYLPNSHLPRFYPNGIGWKEKVITPIKLADIFYDGILVGQANQIINDNEYEYGFYAVDGIFLQKNGKRIHIGDLRVTRSLHLE